MTAPFDAAQGRRAPLANTALRNALLRGRRRPRNLGAGSPTTFRGDGFEFAELRQYVAGDDIRRIDWAATARAGALQTRVILEDVALTLAAIVDDSASMQLGRRSPLLDAAREAMTAWYEAALSDDRCARITSRGLVAPLGMRGRRSALVCANAEKGESAQPFSLLHAFNVARAALPRGAALLVVSDFFDLDSSVMPSSEPVLSNVEASKHGTVADRALRELALRFDCTALIARDPWYDGLPLGGLQRLRDAETGAQATLFIGRRERDRYRNAVADREASLLLRLSQAGWRTGVLIEDDGTASLLRAFGLR